MSLKRKASPSLISLSDSEDERPPPSKTVEFKSSTLGFAVIKEETSSKSKAGTNSEDEGPVVRSGRRHLGGHVDKSLESVDAGETVQTASRTTQKEATEVENSHVSADQDTGNESAVEVLKSAAQVSSKLDEAASSQPQHKPLGTSYSPNPSQLQVQAHARQPPPPEVSAARKAFYDIPEIAEREVSIYSYSEEVEYRNPRKFRLKPFYWKEWTEFDYINLAEHIRWQFDPVPFARANNKTVEETQSVFNSIAVDPLYVAARATKRAEVGMKKLEDAYNRNGTISRPWADGKVKGELEKIGKRTVRIIVNNKNIKVIKYEELGKQDLKYLKDNLTNEDWALFEGVEGDKDKNAFGLQT